MQLRKYSRAHPATGVETAALKTVPDLHGGAIIANFGGRTNTTPEMKKTSIIYAHPYDKSFNAALLAEMCGALARAGRDCEVLDLHRDGFNPVYQPEELALFSRGQYLDPLIERYHKALRESDRVVFLFPIWWGEAPAIVKGFFDKVMLPGFGYKVVDGRMTPGLDIAKTLVVTTSEAPTEVFAPYFEGYFFNMALATIGFRNPLWLNCPGMSTGTLEDRRAFMERVADAVIR